MLFFRLVSFGYSSILTDRKAVGLSQVHASTILLSSPSKDCKEKAVAREIIEEDEGESIVPRREYVRMGFWYVVSGRD